MIYDFIIPQHICISLYITYMVLSCSFKNKYSPASVAQWFSSDL